MICGFPTACESNSQNRPFMHVTNWNACTQGGQGGKVPKMADNSKNEENC